MAYSFIGITPSDVHKAGSNAHLTAETQSGLLKNLMAETDSLSSGFRCQAGVMNQQGVTNACDRVNLSAVQRGHQQGDGFYQIANVTQAHNENTGFEMSKYLNL